MRKDIYYTYRRSTEFAYYHLAKKSSIYARQYFKLPKYFLYLLNVVVTYYISKYISLPNPFLLNPLTCIFIIAPGSFCDDPNMVIQVLILECWWIYDLKLIIFFYYKWKILLNLKCSFLVLIKVTNGSHIMYKIPKWIHMMGVTNLGL